MVEILYKDGTPVPDPNREGHNLTFHIDKKILGYLAKVKVLIEKKDKDWVILIDGYEGAGKSTFGMQMGKFIDPTLDISRVCMTADEFKQTIIDAKKGECVIYDEAVTGLTSGDSVSRIGKLLKSMMMQMRQKNLFVIVILPTVFELNTYAAMSRAKSLFHIYESGGRQGYFVGYNRASTRLLYLKGKKTRSYKVRSWFRGRFYGKYPINEEEYRKKKGEALFSLDDDKKKLTYTDKKHIYGLETMIIIAINGGKKQKEVADGLRAGGYPITDAYISKIWRKHLENHGLRQEFVPTPEV